METAGYCVEISYIYVDKKEIHMYVTFSHDKRSKGYMVMRHLKKQRYVLLRIKITYAFYVIKLQYSRKILFK